MLQDKLEPRCQAPRWASHLRRSRRFVGVGFLITASFIGVVSSAAAAAAATVTPASIHGGEVANNSGFAPNVSTVSGQICAVAAVHQGFPTSDLVTAVAVAMAESGCNPAVANQNGPTSGCPNGSTDRGLWQINNCYHPNVTNPCAYAVECNGYWAYQLSSGGTNWTPWSTYNSGAYKSYITEATNALNELPGGMQVFDNTAQATGALNLTGSNGVEQQHVFFRGTNGSLVQTWWDGSNWNSQPIVGAPSGQPIALSYNPGQQHVFFSDGSGHLEQSFWNGSTWINQVLPGTVSGNGVTAVNYYNAGDNTWEQHIFYNSAGNLGDTWWNGSNWNSQILASGISGTPVALDYMNQNNGVFGMHVFYRTSAGGLRQTFWNGSWNTQSIPGSPSGGFGAANYLNLGSGAWEQHIFFRSNSGVLQQSWWDGSNWNSQPLPGTTTGKPLALQYNPNQQLQLHAFYASGSLNQTWWNNSSWHAAALPGSVSDLLAAGNYGAQNDQQHIFYASGSSLYQTFWNGTWNAQSLPAAIPPS